GDILQATPFDEEGTERFVLAVIGRNRFKKETAAARGIHEPDLRKVDRFSPRCGEHQRRKGPEPQAPQADQTTADAVCQARHRRRRVAQNPLLNYPRGKINRSTLPSQVIRFSGQKLRSLIPDCCSISLRGNRRRSLSERATRGQRRKGYTARVKVWHALGCEACGQCTAF